MLEKFKIEILRLIERHNGELTWFSIARSMTYQEFLPLMDKLGEILRESEKDGLITKSEDNQFYITKQGRAFLQKFSRRPQRETV